MRRRVGRQKRAAAKGYVGRNQLKIRRNLPKLRKG